MDTKKVIEINKYNYRRKHVLRSKRDIITIEELLKSKNEEYNKFGRRMYNQYTKKGGHSLF